MSIRQQDLARLLKVSPMAVSRALRDLPGVNPKLRRRIQEEARKHDYTPDAQFAARVLRGQATGEAPRTEVVAVLVPQIDTPGHFNSRIIRGIVEAAESLGQEIVAASQTADGALPRIVSRRQVDGAVHLLGDVHFLRGHTACPVPWVSLCYDAPGVDVVSVDVAAAMRETGRRLAALGHRRVAYVGPDSPLSRERLEGLRAGLREGESDLPEEAVALKRFAMSPETTLALLAELQVRRPDVPLHRRFTAIAAYNDFMAATVIRCLAERGARVPEDVSVTGFDGALPAEAGVADLTTVALPLEAMGVEAMRLLHWRIRNPDAPRRRVLLDTCLVDGRTCAQASGDSALLRQHCPAAGVPARRLGSDDEGRNEGTSP